MYENGIGVRYDIFKAIDWYEKNANQGNIDTQIKLGNIYSDFTTSGYKDQAMQWYGKACDEGSQIGCDYYKRLKEQGY